MTTKKCTKCKADKPLEQYYANRRDSTGYHTWCKSCGDEVQAKFRKNHPEYLAKHLKASAEENDASRNKATSHGEPWTKGEEDIIRECWASESVTDIAEVLGRTIYSVRYRAKVLGIRKTRSLRQIK